MLLSSPPLFPSLSKGKHAVRDRNFEELGWKMPYFNGATANLLSCHVSGTLRQSDEKWFREKKRKNFWIGNFKTFFPLLILSYLFGPFGKMEKFWNSFSVISLRASSLSLMLLCGYNAIFSLWMERERKRVSVSAFHSILTHPDSISAGFLSLRTKNSEGEALSDLVRWKRQARKK